MVKRLLIITGLIFSLFSFVLALVLESYTYPGFLQKHLGISFASIGNVTLGISSLVALLAVVKIKTRTAKFIFTFTILTSYLFLWLIRAFNQELVAISDGNLEILYGMYHFDIRVIGQAQKLIIPFLGLIGLLFIEDVADIVITTVDMIRQGWLIFTKLVYLLNDPHHRQQLNNFFQFWDLILFAVSILFFWQKQSIFSWRQGSSEFIATVMVVYVVLGTVVDQKKKNTLPIKASVLVWVLMGFLHLLPVFKLPLVIMFSLLTLALIVGLSFYQSRQQ